MTPKWCHPARGSCRVGTVLRLVILLPTVKDRLAFGAVATASEKMAGIVISRVLNNVYHAFGCYIVVVVAVVVVVVVLVGVCRCRASLLVLVVVLA